MPRRPGCRTPAFRLPGKRIALLFGVGAWVLGCEGSSYVLFEELRMGAREPDPVQTAGTSGEPAKDAGAEPDAAKPPPIPDAAPPPDASDRPVPPKVDPDLDPSIVFAWTETLPGQGTCAPARYTGSYTCAAEPPNGLIPLSGPIVFELAGAAEASLAIEKSRLSDVTGTLLMAELEGGLDCVTKQLQAHAIGGKALHPGMPFPSFRPFEAMLNGAFDDQALVIEGELRMVNDAGEACVGTFRVGVAP